MVFIAELKYHVADSVGRLKPAGVIRKGRGVQIEYKGLAIPFPGYPVAHRPVREERNQANAWIGLQDSRAD